RFAAGQTRLSRCKAGGRQRNSFGNPATSDDLLQTCSVCDQVRILLQWTGNPFSLKRGSPRKPNRINGLREFIPCLRRKEGWGSSRRGVCHASQRSTRAFAVSGLRSRSSNRRADKAWQTP